jgi:hypothetical protein
LQWTWSPFGAEPFDCGDTPALQGHHGRKAGKDRLAIDHHRAGAALPEAPAGFQAIDYYLATAKKKPGEFLFGGRRGRDRPITTRQYARLQLLLGHKKIESTVRYLGIEVDDALAIAEQVDV